MVIGDQLTTQEYRKTQKYRLANNASQGLFCLFNGAELYELGSMGLR